MLSIRFVFIRPVAKIGSLSLGINCPIHMMGMSSRKSKVYFIWCKNMESAQSDGFVIFTTNEQAAKKDNCFVGNNTGVGRTLVHCHARCACS